MRTHYDNLQVSRNASDIVIRASYKALLQKYHPDKFEDRSRAERISLILNAAYAVLGDPVRRAEYDATLEEEIQEPDSPPQHASSLGADSQDTQSEAPVTDWSRWWIPATLIVICVVYLYYDKNSQINATTFVGSAIGIAILILGIGAGIPWGIHKAKQTPVKTSSVVSGMVIFGSLVLLGQLSEINARRLHSEEAGVPQSTSDQQQSARDAEWNKAVEAFLKTDCDFKSSHNRKILQLSINDEDERQPHMTDSDLLYKAARRVRATSADYVNVPGCPLTQ